MEHNPAAGSQPMLRRETPVSHEGMSPEMLASHKGYRIIVKSYPLAKDQQKLAFSEALPVQERLILLHGLGDARKDTNLAERADATIPHDPYMLRWVREPWEGGRNTAPYMEGVEVAADGRMYLRDWACFHIKDPEGSMRTLSLEVSVPALQAEGKARIEVYAQETLLNRVTITQAGRYTLQADLSNAYREEAAYLSQAHQRLHGLLRELDQVCTAHHLHYYLVWGSLIGAVRHEGLIPWDDDVDVAMPRRDYEKLKEIGKTCWGTGKEFQLVEDACDGRRFRDYTLRLYDMGARLPVRLGRGEEEDAIRPELKDRMMLDIFVLDDAPANALCHRLQSGALQFIYGLSLGHRGEGKTLSGRWQKQSMVKAAEGLSFLGRHIPLKHLRKCYAFVSKCHVGRTPARMLFMSNAYVMCLPIRYQSAAFHPGRKVPFDGQHCVIPAEPEQVLHAMYPGCVLDYPPYCNRHPTHWAKWRE